MKIRDEKFKAEHMADSYWLDRYGNENWFLFGTLTTAKPVAAPALMKRFRTLMDTLGGPNHCFGKRLHYFARVERSADDQNHLHFLLGRTKVEDGHYHPFTAAEACSFIGRNWRDGIKVVKPFANEKDGVAYVTKFTDWASRSDFYEMSHALKKHLGTMEVMS